MSTQEQIRALMVRHHDFLRQQEQQRLNRLTMVVKLSPEPAYSPAHSKVA